MAAVRAAAAGRQISDAKLKAIDDVISAKMRDLARQDRQRWQGLSRDQRLTEAAQAAMADVTQQAKLKEYRETLQVLRTAETEARIASAATVSRLNRSGALVRDIEQTGTYIDAVRNDAISGLTDMMDVAASKDGTGVLRNLGMRIFDLDNPMLTRDVVREVFGLADGRTGNAAAKAAARGWLDTIETLRLRFNAAGGDVGKLGYGYLSQAHDQVRIDRAGGAKWADDVLPLLDRSQYVREDGSLMTDAQVREMLVAAHKTLATGGDNKTAPGQFKGSGARANRGSDGRVLHFRDGDAWIQYMQQYGEGSLYDAMIGHVGRMARDIGLVERYGPNPEQQFRVQNDIAQRADGTGSWQNRSAGNTPEAYWSLINGSASTPQNRVAAIVGQNARNIQTAAKLGGAVLSSTTDMATIATTLHFNRLPYFEMLANVKKQMDPDTRDFLRSHGVIGEALVSTLNRWTGDHMTHNLTGRLAGSVMKLSLMNAWTDGLRNAFSMTMMHGLSRMAKKGWGQLDEWDRYLLQRKGITEQDWAVVQKAQPTEHSGYAMLTPEGIRASGEPGADQVATKMLAYTLDEAQFAVVNPDLATRAIVTGGGMPAGTIRGETMRAAAQFKSFPIAMLTRHWRRVFETPQGLEGAPAGFGAQTAGQAVFNKVAAIAGLNLSLMLLGAIVLQNKAVVSGKDPFDMTEGKFWLRAVAQGGGAGYLGDLLFKDPSENRPTTTEQTIGSVLGPSIGAAAGFAGDVVMGNAWEMAKGKESHAAAEALRWTNSQLPYASLWWSRSAYERWFLFSAQEALNPGYLSRMRQRAQKDWGQGYWWDPADALPDRAPDFTQAVGGE